MGDKDLPPPYRSSFLKDVYEHLINKIGWQRLLGSVLIFPHIRTIGSFSEIIKKEAERSFLLPEMYTLNQWTEKISQCRTLRQWHLYIEMYRSASRSYPELTFSSFMKWVPDAMRDLMDIDRAGCDADALFENLIEIKEMEGTLMNERVRQSQNAKEASQSDLLQKEVFLIKRLQSTYHSSNTRFEEMRAGHSGWVLRRAYDRMDEYLLHSTKDFILIGFSDFSRLELKLINKIPTPQRHIHWDIHPKYIDAENTERIWRHSAGVHYRNVSKALKNICTIPPHKTPSPTIIEITETANDILEVKHITKALHELLRREPKSSVAVIMLEPGLIIPFLEHLGRVESFNASIDYGMDATSIYRFICVWCEILIDSHTDKLSIQKWIDFLTLIESTMLEVDKDQLHKHLNELKELNVDKISVDKLRTKGRCSQRILKKMVDEISNSTQILLEKMYAYLSDLYPLTHENDKLQREAIQGIQQIVEVIQDIEKVYSICKRTEDVYAFFKNLISQQRINFATGTGASNVQVMSLQQSHALDFDHVMILSAVEGKLPRRGSMLSLVPYDVRRHFGLAIPEDMEQTDSYLLYRLLGRSQSVHLSYNKSETLLSQTEESRIIRQLRLEDTEDSPFEIEERKINMRLAKYTNFQELRLEKSTLYNQKINEINQTKGFSATLLLEYIRDFDEFYKTRILKYRQPEELCSEIPPTLRGTIVHGILEKLTQNYVGRPLDVAALSEMQKRLASVMDEVCMIHLHSYEWKEGENYIFLQEILRPTIHTYLEHEKIKGGVVDRLISVEQSIQTFIKDEDRKIKLYGKVDRIEQCQDVITLVDYKTSSFGKKEIQLKEFSDMNYSDLRAYFESEHRENKLAFQMLFYTYLYLQNHPQHTAVRMQLHTLSGKQRGRVKLVVDEREMINHDQMRHYEENFIRPLFAEIFDQKSLTE